MKPTYEELEQQLEESQREFRAADATIHNLELQLTDMAVQLANSESKCRELAAENSGLKSNIMYWNSEDAEPAKSPLDIAHESSFGEGVEFNVHVAARMPSMTYRVVRRTTYSTEIELVRGGIPETPATDAFLAEVRAQGVTEYASNRGFSFQHGSIHAHFGNGDVMVGVVTFENGDAGINFAPVRDKTGGVGTSYEWTNGKTTEQVDSVFTIASSNAEGLEVIRDKLSEAIAQLRKGAAL
ncbi:hypothetical protein DOV11_04145 [Salmonella enterica]|nr:hypothetical protein [Salmonella enterica]EAU0855621.1 hypothetical protein [Salmonella enterica]